MYKFCEETLQSVQAPGMVMEDRPPTERYLNIIIQVVLHSPCAPPITVCEAWGWPTVKGVLGALAPSGSPGARRGNPGIHGPRPPVAFAPGSYSSGP